MFSIRLASFQLWYPELISNSGRFSRVPGSEPVHLDLEKLFLLSDSMENLQFRSKNKNSEPENKSKKYKQILIRTLFWDELEMSSGCWKDEQKKQKMDEEAVGRPLDSGLGSCTLRI